MVLVNRDSLSVFVAAYLKEQIFLHRNCRPGDYIREMDLSAELGVSRGPVRDAIKKLASEGVLVISPWKGAQVTQLTGEDREDVQGLRGVLEDRLVLLLRADGALKDEVMAELDALVQEMGRLAPEFESLEARERMIDLESQFHDRLFQSAAHPWTEKALRSVYSQQALARLSLSEEAAAAETARGCAALLEKLRR